MQNDALGMRWMRAATLTPLLLVLLLVAACSGPETGDDHDPTPTPLPTATATSTPEPTSTSEPTATSESTETATETAEGTSTAAGSTGTPAAGATATGSATTTDNQPPIEESLPTAEKLPVEGYSVVNQGTRTAIELAQAYADPSEHLTRLNQWGFQSHYFREFTLQADVQDEAAPGYVLTTVNVYGSPDQAAEALQWLRNQNHALGHTFVDPAPELGDEATASTVQTADGVPTAIEFVRVGPRLYAAFAQGGDPLPFIQQLSETMIQGLSGEGEQ